jgi:hypothetical protein
MIKFGKFELKLKGISVAAILALSLNLTVFEISTSENANAGVVTNTETISGVCHFLVSAGCTGHDSLIPSQTYPNPIAAKTPVFCKSDAKDILVWGSTREVMGPALDAVAHGNYSYLTISPNLEAFNDKKNGTTQQIINFKAVAGSTGIGYAFNLPELDVGTYQYNIRYEGGPGEDFATTMSPVFVDYVPSASQGKFIVKNCGPGALSADICASSTGSNSSKCTSLIKLNQVLLNPTPKICPNYPLQLTQTVLDAENKSATDGTLSISFQNGDRLYANPDGNGNWVATATKKLPSGKTQLTYTYTPTPSTNISDPIKISATANLQCSLIDFSFMKDANNKNALIADIAWENGSGEKPCDKSASYQFSLYGLDIKSEKLKACEYRVSFDKANIMILDSKRPTLAYWMQPYVKSLFDNFSTSFSLPYTDRVISPDEAPKWTQNSKGEVPRFIKPVRDPADKTYIDELNKFINDPKGYPLALKAVNSNPKFAGSCSAVISAVNDARLQAKHIEDEFQVALTSYKEMKASEALQMENVAVQGAAIMGTMAAISAALAPLVGTSLVTAPAWVGPLATALNITPEAATILLQIVVDAATSGANAYQVWRNAAAEGPKADGKSSFDTTAGGLIVVSVINSTLNYLISWAEKNHIDFFGSKAPQFGTDYAKSVAGMGNSIGYLNSIANFFSVIKNFKDLKSEIETLQQNGLAHINAYYEAARLYSAEEKNLLTSLTRMKTAMKGCPIPSLTLTGVSVDGDSNNVTKVVKF